ncbi:hypothetical protein ACVWXS_002921 [Lysinibacillus sp. TE18511]
MLLGFNEGDFRSRLLALLLTLRFRTDKTFVADASLSRRAKLPVGERRAASSLKERRLSASRPVTMPS